MTAEGVTLGIRERGRVGLDADIAFNRPRELRGIA